MDKLVEIVEKKRDNLCYNEKGQLLSVDTLIAYLEESKEVIKFLQNYQAQLKTLTMETGPMFSERLPNLSLFIKERPGRPTINAKKAMPILLEFFTNKELCGFVQVPKTAMEDALKAKTEKGDKAGQVGMLLDALKGIGAIEHGHPTRTLVIEAL